MSGTTAEAKYRRMLAGEMVVVGDATLDEIMGLDVANEVASMPNMRQVGTKDLYVAFIYDKLSPSDKKKVDQFLRTSRMNPGEDDDFDLKQEMEDGIVISDGRGGRYAIDFPDSIPGSISVLEWDTALRNIANHMENRQFWPNVFYVNDHGNVDLLALKYRRGKNGKIGNVSSKIVQSWV